MRKKTVGNVRLEIIGEMAHALAESIRQTDLDYTTTWIQQAMKLLRENLDEIIHT